MCKTWDLKYEGLYKTPKLHGCMLQHCFEGGGYMFKFLTYLVDVHNYSVIIMNVIITLSCYQNIEIERFWLQKKSACMRRTSPFTISSSNKYSRFRGSLWFLSYFCGEEKIKSDIFSTAHCHEPLCSPFFLFWCLLFHIPFSTKSHCPLAAFVITDSSLLSFILRLFSTSSTDLPTCATQLENLYQ